MHLRSIPQPGCCSATHSCPAAAPHGPDSRPARAPAKPASSRPPGACAPSPPTHGGSHSQRTFPPPACGCGFPQSSTLSFPLGRKRESPLVVRSRPCVAEHGATDSRGADRLRADVPCIHLAYISLKQVASRARSETSHSFAGAARLQLLHSTCNSCIAYIATTAFLLPSSFG